MTGSNERIVLVTGAGRGIGRAIAARFLASGDRCVLAVRSDAARRELEAELAGEPQAVVERCDVRDRAQVDALAARVRARFGRVDVLVNNAAIFECVDYATRADELDLDVVRRTLETNVLGTIGVCVAFVPLLPCGSRIVNLSSDLGQLGKDGGMTATMVAYSLSKAAVNAYTSALANALHDRGIAVDSLHPGWIRTAMGGPHAPLSVDDGAEAVYALASREPGPTGRFWIDGRVAPW